MSNLLFFVLFLFQFGLAWSQYSNGLDSSVRSTNHDRLIHVAVVVDRNSLKDFMLVLHSAVRAAINPSLVVLHALACGETDEEAKQLTAKVDAAIENCLGYNRREVKPFVLSETSGFKQQMVTNKLNHHWTSPAGADMARFFLPSMFPHAERILYLDNDIVISCCLEEVYDTNLGENGIVGLTLDDLKWATSTQYKRHYNSTHPLVIRNMRRAGKKATYTPPTDESGSSKDTTTGGSGDGEKPGAGGKQHMHKKEKRELLKEARLAGGGKVGLATTAGATLTTEAHDTHSVVTTATAAATGSGSSGKDVPAEQQHSVKHFRKEFTPAAVGPNEAALEAPPNNDGNSGNNNNNNNNMRSRRRRLASVLERNLHPHLNPHEVSEQEFVFHLPRYPNDGVMLFDVQRYNIANILGSLEEIAHANGRGEYVVNLGTQQFTVLTLWDRWVELTPRANLRHFPDMARGYLMWFLYNGVIHYAGQSKPGSICLAEDGMELRKATYTPWATSLYYMTKSTGTMRCKSLPEPVLEESGYANCSRHVPDSASFPAFLALVKRITAANAEDSSLLVRLGAVSEQGLVNEGEETTYSAKLDRHLLYHASWTWRVFDGDGKRLSATKQALATAWPKAQNQLKADFELPEAVAKRQTAREELIKRIAARNEAHPKHKKEKVPPEPKYAANRGHILYENIPVCDGEYPHDFLVDVNSDKASAAAAKPTIRSRAVHAVVDYAGNINPHSTLRHVCKTVLAHLKENRHAHWDIGGIVIDYDTPGARGGTSLGALLALNLHFMRPKFIFVRMSTDSAGRVKPCSEDIGDKSLKGRVRPDTNGYTTAYKMREDVKVYDTMAGERLHRGDDSGQGTVVHRAMRFLSRHGYVAHSSSSSSDEDGCGAGFECVWGTGVTQMELYGY